MRIHHLNTATMCPLGGRLVSGEGGLFHRARLVCHALLIETGEGLVLVETGLGTGDLADPARLGPQWVQRNAPRLDPAETAVAQVRALGFAPDDVRHILLTHMDLDHAGGISDFPKAQVHLYRREYDAAVNGMYGVRKGRYVRDQFAHDPDWKLWDGGGERWFDFDCVRPFTERETDILIVPLHGHTPGHCGIAVNTGEKWLLHAGDAFFHRGQIESPPWAPLGLEYFQRKTDTDRQARIENLKRLRMLNASHGETITIINSHDPVCFDHCVASSSSIRTHT